jgi:PAS domain S-box-containing protein
MALIGLAKVAIDETFLWVNPGYERITGYSGAELLRLRWQDITPPGDRELDQEMVEAILRGERKAYTIRKSYNRKNNGLVHVDLTVAGWFGSNGQISHFLVTAVPREPRNMVHTSADRSELHISSKGEVKVVRNWRWVITASGVSLAAILGWLVSVNTAIGDVHENKKSIEQIEITLAEILRRLPPAKED